MSNNLLGYIDNFINRIDLPIEGRNEIMKAEKEIYTNHDLLELFTKSKIELMNDKISLADALKRIGSLDKKIDIHEYTLHFVFLINCTDILFENYKSNHIDEQIFWDTMEDLRYKLIECHDVMGVWGTFVAGWYADFLNMKRFALGRFQYEERLFEEETYNKNGKVVNKGDRVYNFHIPSSGKPFDTAARIASYRKAYEFFGFTEKGGNMVLVCNSWLLYKGLEKILPDNSRILDFIRDFDIVSSIDSDNFGDNWRIFGKYHKMPLEQLPKDTTLRKAVAEHLLAGGKMGTGFGIIIFDGEKIINK
jgi:hypothetical protein